MTLWYISCHMPDGDVLNLVYLSTGRCLLVDRVDASLCPEGFWNFVEGYGCIDWNIYVFYFT